MQAGFSLSLFVSAAAAVLVGALVLWRSFPLRHAVPVALARVLPSLLYFGALFSGRWTFLDDLTYLSDAIQLKYQGFDPLSILLDPYGIERMESLAGGSHILYTWWNLVAVTVFGDYYFAPVFMNVMLTFIISHLLGKMARVVGFTDAYARGLQLFVLFQWDILAWSSLVNLKDTLVIALTLIGIHAALAMDRKPRALMLMPLLLAAILLLRIRFYVTTLLGLSMAIWGVAFARRRLFLTGAMVTATLLLLITGALQVSFHAEDYFITTDDFAYNIAYFLLTPMPWNIDPSHSFLLLPSILHWLFFIPCLVTAVRLWKENRVLRLLLIYAAVMVVFYAMTPDLQGPRHRMQICFVLAWLQFDFVYRVLSPQARIQAPETDPLLQPAPPDRLAPHP